MPNSGSARRPAVSTPPPAVPPPAPPQVRPLPAAGPSPRRQAISAARRFRAHRARTAEADDGFTFERKYFNKGLLGGLVLIVIAVVWFFAGLAAGIIFLYPPILFCIGLFAIIAGIYDMATGKGRKRIR